MGSNHSTDRHIGPANGPCGSTLAIPDVLASGACALVLIVTVFSMLFVAGSMVYACKKTFLYPNGQLLAVGCLIVLCCLVVVRVGMALVPRLRCDGRKLDGAVLLATVVLLVVQICLCQSYCFVTGWDPWTLSIDAWNVTQGAHIDPWYYSIYPNNRLLFWIVCRCTEAALALGFGDVLGTVRIFTVLNCISCATALWCVYRILSLLASRGCGLVGWLLCVLVMWVSPWAGILYSDPLALCVVPLELLLYIRARKAGGWQALILWVLLGFVGLAGYRIKPQVIFPLLAIVLHELVRIGASIRARRVAWKPLLNLAGVVLGALGASMLCATLSASIAIDVEPWREFGPSHYLMMGLNEETMGVYSRPDVEYSMSFATPDERVRGNVAEIANRLRSMGLPGVSRLYFKKLMTNLNDGTFAWGNEGRFFTAWPLAPPTGIRSLYYEGGSLYDEWRTYSQGVWITMLTLDIISLLSVLASKAVTGRARSGDGIDPIGSNGVGRGEFVCIVAAALLMLICFEVLFEARARYFYSSVSLFILLASLGMNDMERAWSALSHRIAPRTSSQDGA